MMDELRLALIGFGSANQALARMLLDKSQTLPSSSTSPNNDHRHYYLHVQNGGGTKVIPWRVVCIVTRRHGQVCIPINDTTKNNDTNKNNVYEIDLQSALDCIGSGNMLHDRLIIAHKRDNDGNNNEDNQNLYDGGICSEETTSSVEQTLQILDILGKTQTANIVVEAIPTGNPMGTNSCCDEDEPAIAFITKALECKLHVVSANKSPLASTSNNHEETYHKLQQIASENNVSYQHESAVMDGVPIFSLWKYTLVHANLLEIRGCLNSTTTMILARMQEENEGETFQEALEAAKQMGIVEANESLDIDGYDAAVKLRALLVVLTSNASASDSPSTAQSIKVPTMDEIHKDTIRNVTPDDIRRAYANGKKRYRLVASAKLIDDPEASKNINNKKKWEASVKLQQLSPCDPLYNMTGTDSSVTFTTDVLGPITVVSSSPTLVDTAYGLFSDIVRVASSR